MKPEYVQLPTTDVDKINQQVARFAQAQGEIVVGRFVTVSLVSGSTNKIAHGLGSVPKWWTAGSMSAGVVPYEAQGADAQFLYLLVSSNVTVTLWVC